MQNIIDRFLSYVKIDTQSDPTSNTTPSTEKQWILAKKLEQELIQIGMTDVTLDQNGYVMATLASNVERIIPTIGFIAHYDTSPDYKGSDIQPRVITNYDGKDIILNEQENIVLSPNYFDDLKHYKGQTLITTDGTTLLGADDKAGVTEIVTAMEYLIQNPHIHHGTVRVAFTPDEEIGRGAHKFDVKKFGAQWAYTMDGSQIGELEYENFNAAEVTISVKGKSVHPGYAKGKMINAIMILNEFLSLLPKKEKPQFTAHREGFFHFYKVDGSIELAQAKGIIRDHDRLKFDARKELIEQIIGDLTDRFGNIITLEIQDQYYNMKEKIEPVMHIVDIAEQAMQDLDIKPIIKPIRGGTDGSQLSYMGLPCPNIFAGGHNFHGPYEYVPVESMERATDVIVKIIELTSKYYDDTVD